MSDYPDGMKPVSTTIDADTTGLAKDIHVFNSTDALSIYDHLKQVRTQIDAYLKNLDIALSELKAVGTAQTPRTLSELYDQLTSLYGRLDITQSGLRDSLLAEEQVYSQLWGADETLAQSEALDTKGHGKAVSIYAHATAATTFTVDVSMDNTNWVNFYTSGATETDYSGALTDAYRAFRYVKISSAAAGAAGDTVTLIFGAK